MAVSLCFMLKKRTKKFLDKFKKMLYVPFRFDYTGSQIVYYSHAE